MLNKLLAKSKFVRTLQGEHDASMQELVILNEAAKESRAMVEALLSKQDDLESEKHQLQQLLDIERTKRIAAEQIAVSRETELEWLRDQFVKAQEARDLADSKRIESLDLVNITLMKRAEADTPPTKAQMADWKPVPKDKQQPVPLMRKMNQEFIKGLREQERKRLAKPVENVS